MPALEDVPKILSEKEPDKGTTGVNYIDPSTVMSVCHQLKGFPQGLILLDLHFLDSDILE